jgi:Xaa-Pro aminopeptidase
VKKAGGIGIEDAYVITAKGNEKISHPCKRAKLS